MTKYRGGNNGSGKLIEKNTAAMLSLVVCTVSLKFGGCNVTSTYLLTYSLHGAESILSS